MMSTLPKAFERFSDYPPHPLAFSHKSGACGMKSGDIVQYMNGRPVRLDEALSDGDAFCTLADGSYATLKWNNMRPWPGESKP